MADIVFTEKAWEQYCEWLLEDKKTVKKINKLIKSINRDGPINGEGKPEKLSYEPGAYSRRIDEANRLVYSVTDGQIKVIACKGHYEE